MKPAKGKLPGWLPGARGHRATLTHVSGTCPFASASWSDAITRSARGSHAAMATSGKTRVPAGSFATTGQPKIFRRWEKEIYILPAQPPPHPFPLCPLGFGFLHYFVCLFLLQRPIRAPVREGGGNPTPRQIQPLLPLQHLECTRFILTGDKRG